MPETTMIREAVLDIQCVGCGYDLRHLDLDGVCPECAKPVAESIPAHPLVSADPRWLRGVTRAQRAIASGLSLIVYVGLVFVLTSIMAIFGLMPPGVIIAVTLLGLALGLAGCVIAVIGAMFVTSHEPGRAEAQTAPPRRRARFGILTAVGAYLVSFGMSFVLGPFTFAPMIILGIVGTVALAIGIVALLQCQARLAERIPDLKLTARLDRAAGVLRWGLHVYVVGLLVSALATFGLLPPSVGMALFVFVMFMRLAILVYGVAVTIMMRKLSRAMRGLAKRTAPTAPVAAPTAAPMRQAA